MWSRNKRFHYILEPQKIGRPMIYVRRKDKELDQDVHQICDTDLKLWQDHGFEQINPDKSTLKLTDTVPIQEKVEEKVEIETEQINPDAKSTQKLIDTVPIEEKVEVETLEPRRRRRRREDADQDID